MSLKPIVVVGGGIAGLSTAWYLQQRGIPYVLLEQGSRWGGKILTEQVQDATAQTFVVEGGPDSFITQKPWGQALAKEVGLGPTLIGTNERLKQTYVLKQGQTGAPPRRRADDCPYQIHAVRDFRSDLSAWQAAHGDGSLHPTTPRRQRRDLG